MMNVFMHFAVLCDSICCKLLMYNCECGDRHGRRQGLHRRRLAELCLGDMFIVRGCECELVTYKRVRGIACDITSSSEKMRLFLCCTCVCSLGLVLFDAFQCPKRISAFAVMMPFA